MRDVVERVGKVTSLIQDISTATGEENNGIQQVGSAVQSLDQVTQQNAALVEQAAAAAQAMSEQATELRSAVGIFKTGGGVAVQPRPASPRPAKVVNPAPKVRAAAARALPPKAAPTTTTANTVKKEPSPPKAADASGEWETF